jgi:hypothetical protein
MSTENPPGEPSVSVGGDVKDGNLIVGDGNRVQQGDIVARDKVIQNIQNVNFDIEKLVAALKESLPEGDPTPQYLLDALKSFQHYHASLHEWKELHNFLNDVLFMFAPFTLEIDRLEIAQEQPNPRLLVRLWRPISQKVDALLEWGKSIEHIGTPFVQSPQGLQGDAWAVDLYIVTDHLDQMLKSQQVDASALFDARGEFSEKAETHMYLADKKLRQTADELYSLSRVVLGSLNRG